MRGRHARPLIQRVVVLVQARRGLRLTFVLCCQTSILLSNNSFTVYIRIFTSSPRVLVCFYAQSVGALVKAIAPLPTLPSHLSADESSARAGGTHSFLPFTSFTAQRSCSGFFRKEMRLRARVGAVRAAGCKSRVASRKCMAMSLPGRLPPQQSTADRASLHGRCAQTQ